MLCSCVAIVKKHSKEEKVCFFHNDAKGYIINDFVKNVIILNLNNKNK